LIYGIGLFAFSAPDHTRPAKIINVTASDVYVHLTDGIVDGRDVEFVNGDILFQMVRYEVYFFEYNYLLCLG